MTKIDFKKEYKKLYSAKENIFFTVNVPKFEYITVNGSGHPKEKEFQQSVEALYNSLRRVLTNKRYCVDNYLDKHETCVLK